MARDPRWARQFTENSSRDGWSWRSPSVRFAILLWLGFLSLGVLTESPVVDTIVVIFLFAGPVTALLALVRRDADAEHPAPWRTVK